MERRTILWALVAFFGASLVFGGVQELTEDQGFGVTLAAQVAALAAIIALVVVLVRRSDR